MLLCTLIPYTASKTTERIPEPTGLDAFAL